MFKEINKTPFKLYLYKMKMHNFLLTFILFTCNYLTSQSWLTNIGIGIDTFDSVIGNTILSDQDNIYIIGDLVSYKKNGSFICVYDAKSGEKKDCKVKIESKSSNLFYWHRSGLLLDSLLYVGRTYLDGSNLYRIFCYDKSTLELKKIYHSDEFITPFNYLIDSHKNISLIGEGIDKNNNYVSTLKYIDSTNKVKTIELKDIDNKHKNNGYQYGIVSSQFSKGNFIINLELLLESAYRVSCCFLKINREGELLRSICLPFESDTMVLIGAGFLAEDDESVIVSGFSGVPYYRFPGSTEIFDIAITPIVFRLDTLGKLLWKTELNEGKYSISSRFNNLIKSKNGKHVFIAGEAWNKDYKEEEKEGVYYELRGFGAKVDATNGKLLWRRTYSFEGQDFSKGDQAQLKDVTQLEDGSLAMIGRYRAHLTDSTYSYKMWLIKTDSFGCLVPGCEKNDITNTKNEYDINVKVSISPNPSNDFINIYFQNDNKISFVIYDNNGKVMGKGFNNLDKNTLIYSVSNYPSGTYYIKFIDNTLNIRLTKEFIKI